MQPILSLKNITKNFGKKKVLNNLSLDLYEGEILGLIGRSGCGKTTLIKILVGYHTPDSGEITYQGKQIKKNFLEVKKTVGYTTQENSFYEKLTILENMNYYANLYNVKDKKRIEYLMTSVGPEQSKKLLAEKISGGMKRRLDFAISLIHNPRIVILDEPTTGLDPILVENFWKIVLNIVHEQKICVLVVTHMLSEINSYCNRAAIMHKGEVIATVKPNVKLESMFRKMTE